MPRPRLVPLTSPSPHRSPGSPRTGQPYSSSEVREISARIVALSVAAGLHPVDAEDLSQDVCLWLLRAGSPTLALCGPWLAAVVRNYVLRYRRQRGRITTREGTTLDDIAEPAAPPERSAFERGQFLDRMTDLLPQPERQLLRLVRSGLTVVQAARALGIPRGSCDYYRKRLITLARATLDARRRQRPHSPASLSEHRSSP